MPFCGQNRYPYVFYDHSFPLCCKVQNCCRSGAGSARAKVQLRRGTRLLKHWKCLLFIILSLILPFCRWFQPKAGDKTGLIARRVEPVICKIVLFPSFRQIFAKSGSFGNRHGFSDMILAHIFKKCKVFFISVGFFGAIHTNTGKIYTKIERWRVKRLQIQKMRFAKQNVPLSLFIFQS